MKKPFVMMAVMAAAMSAAYRENAYRDAGMSMPSSGSRTRQAGKKNPAGTKLILRYYKAKHGHKAASVEEAREWYAEYLQVQDAAVREKEDRLKRDREARRNPLPLAA